MYKSGFRIKENTGNNSFSYNIRKLKNPEPKIYVTNLIQGTINDVQIGNKIVFEEIILNRQKNQGNEVFLDDGVIPRTGEAVSVNSPRRMKGLQFSKAVRCDSKGQIQSFLGLKNFIKLKSPLIKGGGGDLAPIYIFDNHNHALFFRYQELFDGNISRGINLIHIDQHTDMNKNSEFIIKNAELKDIFHFVNYKCNVGNFIQPAIQDGLISKVIQINTEYKLLTFDFGLSTFDYILDIDLDFWHPQMGIEQYNKTIEITKNLISQASLVTIATSPHFLDQTLAIKILKDIF